MTRNVLLVMLAATGSAACATASLNRAELNGSEELGHRVEDVPVRGFAVVVEAGGVSYQGELLAVGQSAVWIEMADGHAVPIPRRSILRVRVHVHDTYGGEYGGWTAAGSASTITHGLLLVFSAPVWLIAGTATSFAETGTGLADARGGGLDNLDQYARFPQGPPPALTGVPAPPTMMPAPPPRMPPTLPLAVPPAPGAPDAPPIEIPAAPLWYEHPPAMPPAP